MFWHGPCLELDVEIIVSVGRTNVTDNELGQSQREKSMEIQKVTKIISDVCQIEEANVVADRDLLEYGMDSARAVDLVIALEDAFDVEISDELMIRLRTANDIALALKDLQA